MAITYQSASALAYSASAPVVTLPATINAGDLLVAFVGIKPDTATCATPSGWTALGNTAGGGGTTGADTGPTRIYAFYKVAVGTEDGTTVTFTLGTSPNVGWAQAYRLSNATGNWSLGYAGGTDSTTGTAWSVTTSSDPGITAGDLCLVGSVIPTDVTTPSQFSAEAISATGVSAWGTMVEVSEPDTSTGSDLGGFVFYVPVTTGTATAAPVITATAGGTPSVAAAASTDSGVTPPNRVTWPARGMVISTSGQRPSAPAKLPVW
jgi:hypothetical protein